MANAFVRQRVAGFYSMVKICRTKAGPDADFVRWHDSCVAFRIEEYRVLLRVQLAI